MSTEAVFVRVLLVMAAAVGVFWLILCVLLPYFVWRISQQLGDLHRETQDFRRRTEQTSEIVERFILREVASTLPPSEPPAEPPIRLHR